MAALVSCEHYQASNVVLGLSFFVIAISFVRRLVMRIIYCERNRLNTGAKEPFLICDIVRYYTLFGMILLSDKVILTQLFCAMEFGPSFSRSCIFSHPASDIEQVT